MKLSSINPIVMKTRIHPDFYFSAYPLKALNLPETEDKSSLHIYKNSDGYIRLTGSSKVFPMINPYKEKNTKPAYNNDQPDSIEEKGTEWFASYE